MFVIYDQNSKQWVGLVDLKYSLVPTQYLAHEFLLEAVAGAVIGELFSGPPYSCVIQKVAQAP